MTNTTIALVFVMFLNVLMFLSQLSMINIADADPTIFYHCEGSILETFGSCENYTVSGNPSDSLPTAQATITPSSGSIFTDIFNNILSWIKGLPGVGYLVAIVLAPSTILQAIGLPAEVSFILGVLWYGITLFLIVAFLWGRE